jgi:hypothetical protein
MHTVCYSNYIEETFHLPKRPYRLLCIMTRVLLPIKMSVFSLVVIHNGGLTEYPRCSCVYSLKLNDHLLWVDLWIRSGMWFIVVLLMYIVTF